MSQVVAKCPEPQCWPLQRLFMMKMSKHNKKLKEYYNEQACTFHLAPIVNILPFCVNAWSSCLLYIFTVDPRYPQVLYLWVQPNNWEENRACTEHTETFFLTPQTMQYNNYIHSIHLVFGFRSNIEMSSSGGCSFVNTTTFSVTDLSTTDFGTVEVTEPVPLRY